MSAQAVVIHDTRSPATSQTTRAPSGARRKNMVTPANPIPRPITAVVMAAVASQRQNLRPIARTFAASGLR